MGTRADFYLGRGSNAKWLGSIGWDGYPDGIDKCILGSSTPQMYARRVKDFIKKSGGTLPEEGWPWPWKNSNTTDYAYAFEKGKVYGTYFGHGWWIATKEPDGGGDEPKIPDSDWPDMTKIQNVQMGSQKSGVIVISRQITPTPNPWRDKYD